ncbi:MAG: phage portal protein [Desulfobacteraceae bacterium]|nr:phage portal protein [Desulfobacteraceae bacterium]
MKLTRIRNLDLRKKSVKRSASYAAAKPPTMSNGWNPSNASVNTIIAASTDTMRARIRQLVRDFPYFARAVNVLVDYIVGEGIGFQSKIQRPNGELNEKLIQQTEDSLNFWADQADFSGNLHYYEMMRLAKRQDSETGEFILIKRWENDPKRYLPLCYQMVEPEWLTDMGARLSSRHHSIEQGIEYDTRTGKAIAYHFSDPDSYGPPIRVEAEHVIHKFDTLRPGQRRGVSPFAPGVLVADDLASMMDAEISATQAAAKWVAIIKRMAPPPELGQYSLGQQPHAPQHNQDTEPPGERIDYLENSIIEYLRPGEDVELKANPRPSGNFPPFVRMVLCMFAVVSDVPYELISGDYSGLSYATLRAIRNDFASLLRPKIKRHIRHFCDPTILPFFQTAVVCERLRFPVFFANPLPWIRREWQPPGQESVDPLREVKSRIDEVNTRLRSPQEVIRARGRDPETVVKETAQFFKICEKHKVLPKDASTALANNPAAVEKQD